MDKHSKTDGEMVCAVVSWVNMVSATIQTDTQDAVSIELTHLPRDVNYLHSSNFSNVTTPSVGTIETFPIERHTLSDKTDVQFHSNTRNR